MGLGGDFTELSEPVALLSLTEAEDWARTYPGIVQLWGHLREHVDEVAGSLGAYDRALSLEICPETFHDTGRVRLHCHAFFMNNKKAIAGQLDKVASYKGCRPVHGKWHSSSRFCAFNSGMYYIVAPKVGQVFSFSTKEPFKQFPVDGDWIMNLLQGGKITTAKARVELIKTAKNLVRRMADLEKYVALKEEDETEDRIKSVRKAISGLQRPFRTIPMVTAFLRKYITNRGPIARKKILVLDGPSGLGKTEFVRSLFLRDALLELNAASMQVVCLPGFRQQGARAILWDECRAELVARNRKVFQHGTSWVDVGHSPTGQHVKRYFLNDSVPSLRRTDGEKTSRPSFRNLTVTG